MIEEEEREDFSKICATPEYIGKSEDALYLFSNPEILLGERMSKDSDYWALGFVFCRKIILFLSIYRYEMLIGIPPFYH